MSRKYAYHRISAEELSARLDALGMSARELARLSSAGEDRVIKWLTGKEDVDPKIDLLTFLLLHSEDNTLAATKRWAGMRAYVREEAVSAASATSIPARVR